jgi:pimeloyl-ACP methyl ester carboxylesterase
MTDTEFAARHSRVDLGKVSLHVVEAGDPAATPFVFLHGWPQSWRAWLPVMTFASKNVRPIAIDLPAVGESAGEATDGSKRALAEVVHQLIAQLDLQGTILVGQDVGGMVTYAYLREYHDLAGAVIMDVVLPGLDPWDQVLRNPYIWHFAFHAIPDLPERLVDGHLDDYFAYFYEVLSPDPQTITPAARAAYIQAYASPAALTAGFNWYRAFAQDAVDNQAPERQRELRTPVLYLRGEHESGNLADYVAGLAAAGLVNLESGLIPGAGHFSQEDAPEEVWRTISQFAEVR